MLHLRYSAVLWLCFDFKIYQSCEYTRVINMLVLHKVIEKKGSYCTINAWQDSKYFSGSKYGRVAQGSEQNAPL